MRTRIHLATLLVAFAIAAAYANSLSGPFILDDLGSIPDNPTIRRLSRLGTVLSPPGEGVAVQNRPVVNLTLAINYAVGGLNPVGYHLFNLGVHILAALTLLGIIRRTLLLPKFADRFGPRALAYAVPVALLWGLHPINTEAITYIIQRTESLFSMFYLLTLYCCIRGHGSKRRHGRWYAAAVAACFAGMGCKEAMVTEPVMMLLYDRVFVAGTWREVFRRRWGLYAGLASAWLLLAWILLQGQGGRGTAAGFGLGTSAWEYARTQFWAICRYLRLTFWPSGFVVHYGTWIARTPGEIIPYAIVICFLIAATLAAYLRWPWAGYLGTWFFVVLAPSSSILPLISQTAAEKRMYLPLAAVVTLAVFLAAALGEYILNRLALPDSVRRRGRVWAVAATTLLALVLGALTARRNHDYRSALAILDDTIRKWPNNPNVYLGRACAYEDLGDSDRQIADCNKAIELLPTYAHAYVNRGNAYADKGDYARALADYSKALEINPRLAEAYNNRGLIYAQLGDVQRALDEYTRALAINPQHIEAHANRALLFIRQGDLARAQADLDALEKLDARGPLMQLQELIRQSQSASPKPR
ncbi:MAG: tetratricopeptide repeat protein [Candidatus Sumerlaeia bacterium]|nr:tetratricopeptide repeat protein [Candidatus Sumerlaeia bacterium]